MKRPLLLFWAAFAGFVLVVSFVGPARMAPRRTETWYSTHPVARESVLSACRSDKAQGLSSLDSCAAAAHAEQTELDAMDGPLPTDVGTDAPPACTPDQGSDPGCAAAPLVAAEKAR